MAACVLKIFALSALISDVGSSCHSAESLKVFKEVPVRKKELMKMVLLVRGEDNPSGKLKIGLIFIFENYY